jgi:hypothetical protein
VELVDVYATLNDVLDLPKTRESVCDGLKCKPLQGKSLAPVLFHSSAASAGTASAPAGSSTSGLLGSLRQFFQQNPGSNTPTTSSSANVATAADELPMLPHNFAISQVVRCAPLNEIPAKRMAQLHSSHTHQKERTTRKAIWSDCDLSKPRTDQMALLGYAMRTPEYRYVAYFHFDHTTQKPNTQLPPFEEELYDHKNESLADFTHRETFNLAVRAQYNTTILGLRTKLVHFIDTKIAFGDH